MGSHFHPPLPPNSQSFTPQLGDKTSAAITTHKKLGKKLAEGDRNIHKCELCKEGYFNEKTNGSYNSARRSHQDSYFCKSSRV